MAKTLLEHVGEKLCLARDIKIRARSASHLSLGRCPMSGLRVFTCWLESGFAGPDYVLKVQTRNSDGLKTTADLAPEDVQELHAYLSKLLSPTEEYHG